MITGSVYLNRKIRKADLSVSFSIIMGRKVMKFLMSFFICLLLANVVVAEEKETVKQDTVVAETSNDKKDADKNTQSEPDDEVVSIGKKMSPRVRE